METLPTSLPTQSEATAEITAALCKAITKFPEVKKERTAKVRSKKGEESSYSYKYADLSDILAAVNPALSEFGLALRWATSPSETGTVLTGFLMHVSGQWFSSSLRLPTYGDDQARGSGLSYNKRYLVGMLLPVAATEPDDDGQRAVKDADDQDETTAILERKRKEREEKQSGADFKSRCTPASTIPAQTVKQEESAIIKLKTEANKATQVVAGAEESVTTEADHTPIDDVPKHRVTLQLALEREKITVDQFMQYLTSPRPTQNKGNIRPKGFTWDKIDATLATTLMKPENWKWVCKFGKDGTL